MTTTPFVILNVDIDGNDVFVQVNQAFGINYMLYLTCCLKNNTNVKLCGSTGNVIHFQLADSQNGHESAIDYIRTIVV